MITFIGNRAVKGGFNLSRFIVRGVCGKSATTSTPVTPPHLGSSDQKEEQQNVKAPDQIDRINSHMFCFNHVKRHDRENYLAALCIHDKMMRRVIFALRAFNVELSLVRDMTTNSDRAKLRFHFWSKLLDEIIKRNEFKSHNEGWEKDIAYYKQTPVAKELLDLFRLVEIDKDIESNLRDLVGARVSSKVLGYQPFNDMRELELYCHKSNTPVYQLTWRMYFQMRNNWNPDIGLCRGLDVISSCVGQAQGLSNVIRGIPYNSKKNCCYIPQDILSQYNLTNRDFINKKLDGEKLKPVVEALAIRCQELNDKAYLQLDGVPKHFKQIFLPRVSVGAYLKKLKKCNYNVCDPKVNRRNEMLPLSLKLASIYFRAPIL